MNVRGNRFEVDREEGKLLGVCAGIARRTGLDVTIVRVAVVLAALVTHVMPVLLLYLAAAFVGRRKCVRVAVESRGGTEPASERVRSHELRMKAIETYVAGSNSRLAREIEELR